MIYIYIYIYIYPQLRRAVGHPLAAAAARFALAGAMLEQGRRTIIIIIIIIIIMVYVSL